MSAGRAWRAGTGTLDTSISEKVNSRPDRHTYVNGADRLCDHTTCDARIEMGELVYRSRNGDWWYCSKICRERHSRLRTQLRRRTDPATRTHDNSKRIERKYGVSSAQWEEMYHQQGGKCAICRVSFDDQDAHVDHDHSCCPGAKTCGKCIRALLCSKCNIGLGFFSDSPALLRKAAKYIEARESALAVRRGEVVSY